MARTLYQKFRDLWKDKPDKTTPVTAEALNHIEQGIYDNSNNMALKEIYDDNAISLGRDKNSVAGNKSTACGSDVVANGTCSQAFGLYVRSLGYASHAEGCQTIAEGNYSHAEGYYTIAKGECQHVQGKYSEEDTSNKYAHIVGGGTYSDRKNIHTIDWNGNGWFEGDVTTNEDSLSGISAFAMSYMVDVTEQCSVNTSGNNLEITIPIDGFSCWNNQPTSVYGCFLGLINFQQRPPFIFRAQLSESIINAYESKKGVAKLINSTTYTADYGSIIDGSIEYNIGFSAEGKSNGTAKITFNTVIQGLSTNTVGSYKIYKAVQISDLVEKLGALEQRIAELEGSE